MSAAQTSFVLRMRTRRLVRMVRAQVLVRTWPGFHAAWGAQVGRGCRILVEPGAHITLGRGVEVDDGSTIAALGAGHVEIADGAFVGHHCTIAARHHVRVGERTFLAELVSVRDHDHDPNEAPSSGHSLIDPVVIGADVWIAAKATVVRGVTIGERCVVAAHAVVRDDTPPFSVVAGVPAKVVRSIGS